MENPTVKNRTTVSDREIATTRLLNAPRELVWKVWTTPEHITNWWGPNGFSTTTKEMALKAGGVWRFTMHGPDGRDYLNKVVFIEVGPPARLVYRHSDDGEAVPVSFHVEVTFEAQGDKTLLTLSCVFETPEELQRVERENGAIEGQKQTIARLADYLAEMS